MPPFSPPGPSAPHSGSELSAAPPSSLESTQQAAPTDGPKLAGNSSGSPQLLFSLHMLFDVFHSVCFSTTEAGTSGSPELPSSRPRPVGAFLRIKEVLVVSGTFRRQQEEGKAGVRRRVGTFLTGTVTAKGETRCEGRKAWTSGGGFKVFDQGINEGR